MRRVTTVPSNTSFRDTKNRAKSGGNPLCAQNCGAMSHGREDFSN
jgi:hypothetical protein